MSKPPTTASALLARYAAGERDFRKANLRDANLRGARITFQGRTVTVRFEEATDE